MMFNLAANGTMEIFVERQMNGLFTLTIDGDVSANLSKVAANLLADESFRVAQDLEMSWKIYDADKLK